MPYFLFSVQNHYNFRPISVQNGHSKYVIDIIAAVLGAVLLEFRFLPCCDTAAACSRPAPSADQNLLPRKDKTISADFVLGDSLCQEARGILLLLSLPQGCLYRVLQGLLALFPRIVHLEFQDKSVVLPVQRLLAKPARAKSESRIHSFHPQRNIAIYSGSVIFASLTPTFPATSL